MLPNGTRSTLGNGFVLRISKGKRKQRFQRNHIVPLSNLVGYHPTKHFWGDFTILNSTTMVVSTSATEIAF